MNGDFNNRFVLNNSYVAELDTPASSALPTKPVIIAKIAEMDQPGLPKANIFSESLFSLTT